MNIFNKFFLNLFTKNKSSGDFDTLIYKANSYNGYEREEAVKQLGELNNPMAMPILLLRVNDWVQQVRSASLKAIDKLLLNENAEIIVQYLPEIYKLQSYKRENHTELFARLLSFLLKEENSSYLVKAIDSQNIVLSRISFNICAKHQLLSTEQCVKKGLSSKDVILKTYAAKLLSSLKGKYLEDSLAIAIYDKFMFVRKEAFQIYLKKYPKKGLSFANKFLFDRSFTIREIAIRYLQKNNVNVEAIYVNVLKDKKSSILYLKCAIDELGYLGSTRTIFLIGNFITHSSSTVRKVTLEALVALKSSNSKEYLLQGMQDISAKVAKRASRLLVRNIVVDTEEIFQISKVSKYNHTLSFSLFSVRTINRWERLLFLLRLFDSTIVKDKAQKSILQNELRHWDTYFNQTCTQPTQKQIYNIISAYNKSNGLLEKDIFEILELTIHTLQRQQY